MDTYESRTLVDEGGDVAYVPYVTGDGRVGYIVKRGDEVGYIYLNPSRNTHDDERSPDVFVYGGPNNDTVTDEPLTFVLVEPTMLTKQDA